MKEYNKLVRDNIPRIIEDSGKRCKFHLAKSDEYEEKLYEKLQEELFEFVGKPCAEEIADMLEVIEAIAKFHKISLTEIKAIKIDKKLKRGGFRNKVILNCVDE